MGYSQLVAAKKMVRERVRKYGLRSQKRASYLRSERMLEENGFAIAESSKNCLFTNAGSESMKHWLVKSIVFKILSERKRQVGTEVEVNGGIVDVLDIDNMIAYEVENRLTKRKLAKKLNSLSGLRDVFFIDILEISDDMFEAEVYLREKIV